MVNIMATGAEAKQAAKNIRFVLKSTFPNTKFSVQQHTASMSHQYSIRWIGGPSEEDVKELAAPFITNVACAHIRCGRCSEPCPPEVKDCRCPPTIKAP
jgi:hypothetical protein